METVGFFQNLKSLIFFLFSVNDIDDHYVFKIFGIKFCKKHSVKIEINKVTEQGVTQIKRNPQVIVSLTTFPARIDTVYKTISTLMHQTVKADRIILWLASMQFPDKNLPQTLINLQQYGLEIKWIDKDIRSFKKLIPALKEFPKDIIITADDDIFYPEKFIENLYNLYLKNPQYIHANRAFIIKKRPNERLYLKSRNYEYNNSYLPSYKNELMSGYGTLFPPDSLDKTAINNNLFMNIMPTNDDIWSWGMAVLKGTKIKVNPNGYKLKLIEDRTVQTIALKNMNRNDTNVGMSGRDGINKMCELFPEIEARVYGYINDVSHLNNGKLKISVIMPVYNAEKYLKEAMDSIINQTLQDIEIICVNDGSTDNSLNILKEYAAKDNRIKIIDKENQGYGATVNRGFAEANGEFAAIFEPDDILDKTIYEKLYVKAISNNLDVVKCNFYNYWSKKNLAKRSGLIKRCAKKKPFAPKDNLKMFTCHASVWAGIYRKSFLEKNNIKFLETPGASFQDMSFNFKVIASSPQIMLLEEPLLYYRQDNPNSSINNPKKIYCVCDEYEELTRFLNENKDLKELFNTQKLINQYGAYKWNMSRLNKDFHKEFLDKFSQDFKTFYENGEIKKEFYKSVSKHELNLLLNNTEKYYKKIICKKQF